MKQFVLIILFLFSFNFTQSQNDSGEKYLSDFKILVDKLEKLYPLVYKSITKEQFDINVKEANIQLILAKNKNQAAYIIQKFMHQFKDVHASVSSIYENLGVKKILPFKVLIFKNELYIKNYPSNPKYNGAKINYIDNVNTKIIIECLKVLYSDDGNRLYGFVIQPLFNSFYAAFINQKDTFNIKTDKGLITAPAVKTGDTLYNSLIKNSWVDYMMTDQDYLKKEITEKYGYFRFLSFDKKHNGFQIENEYNSLIANLNKKNIPNLIIDLRYNSGGDPYLCGRMVAQLIDKPFQLFEKILVKNSETTDVKNKDSFKEIHNDKCLKTIKQSKKLFKGTIYIIVGPMTGSTSTMFCKYLMGQNNVVFVGSETPGAINYFCAHKYYSVNLPNIGIKTTFGLNLIELKNGSSENEKPQGLIPENYIHYTIQEILNGKDKEMVWIIKHITIN